MKLFYKFVIFLLIAFSSKSIFSQGREIPNLSLLLTDSVEVGDSCFIPCLFYLRPHPETILACDSIYTFLKENPTVSIAIIVHSDYRPIPMTNDTLTLRRAMHLKEEILKHEDIDFNRIVAIGMADRQPRIVTKEIHKQYNFLPVGQIIDEEFSRSLPNNKDREIALSFNRRTVVKIIGK
jgi:outer membrane protein OmpA-like peptidoglycan-associated protein